MRETTALGAAFAAGLAVNVWKDTNELERINRDDRTIFKPSTSDEERLRRCKRWERAVGMARGWEDSSAD